MHPFVGDVRVQLPHLVGKSRKKHVPGVKALRAPE